MDWPVRGPKWPSQRWASGRSSVIWATLKRAGVTTPAASDRGALRHPRTTVGCFPATLVASAVTLGTSPVGSWPRPSGRTDAGLFSHSAVAATWTRIERGPFRGRRVAPLWVATRSAGNRGSEVCEPGWARRRPRRGEAAKIRRAHGITVRSPLDLMHERPPPRDQLSGLHR